MYSIFQKKTTTSNGVPPDGFLTVQEFQERLKYERARADRSGSKFSMLALQVVADKDTERADIAKQVLARILRKQSRTIDVRGAHGEGLALIMPYTPSDKAERVWAKVQDSFNRRVAAEVGEQVPSPELRCDLYVYPGTEKAVHLGSKAGHA